MELGLSLGDRHTTTTTTTSSAVTTTVAAAGVNDSLGFCMALGMNPSKETNIEKEENDDDENSDDEDDEKDDDQKIIEEININIVDNNQRIISTNPPVQLDLLPSGPVTRHNTSFPWSSDNGSSEGGSSGNVRRMPVAMGTEEATSSFRLEFMSNFGRLGNGASKNHKRGFEIGNDVVHEVERASSRASDEDENGMSRKKLRLSKEQSAFLEESFKEHHTLNPKQKLALAQQLSLRPRQVEVWFQNRRARTKLKQTEVDYEYLKRCCESLTIENKKLHKELQELRALKTTSHPFYMQHPATTLTMCPSCERVATTSPPPPATTSTKAVVTLSPKPRSFFPVAPPSTNSHHPHATSS
uniref:homeobox-leucine zipper protein HOX11-like n=1 Tax=Erigeron canadensis TaxID=72917 RepID=UPI001CB93311|nr:homeobox-leucine zipper protein HOX11-like [Erigeron canadensis]